MQPTRIIKIFLASSNELEHDRDIFGNLVRRLDNLYEKRGSRIYLFEWEDCDAAYKNRRKQDEYNDEVRASDMFIALFYRKAGEYTIEEFDVATAEFERTGTKPKPYVFCRNLVEGDVESNSLLEFKRRLSEDLQYFWIHYGNKESLCLHFVMQLQLWETSRLDGIRVEDGNVTLDGLPVARMDGLPFAANNPDFQRMSQRLAELPLLVEKARLRAERYPDDNDLRDDLQRLLDERIRLQKAFDQQQSFILDTAKRIARLQGELITDRMRRAIEAFEKGDVHQSNVILNEAERDADRNFAEFRRSKDVTELRRQAVIHSIEELLLKTSTLMADGSIRIEKRIETVAGLYTKADEMAQEVEYDKEKYADLLLDFSGFLYKYGRYAKALTTNHKLISLTEDLYGEGHPYTATSYNNSGMVYSKMGDYPQALEYYWKALTIRERVFGGGHPDTAASYNNIGAVYDAMGDYPKALEYYRKALAIRERVFGREHPDTAGSYNNIGMVYSKMSECPQALKYYRKALTTMERVLGGEHPDTAASYNNIGVVYDDMGDYPQAMEYYQKALTIRERVLGREHPDTATSYNNIGSVYSKMSGFPQALEYYRKALSIWERVLGWKHPDTATSYNNIGIVYDAMGDYPKALEYYREALAIRERVLGEEHPDTAVSYNSIGIVYDDMGDYPQALEYYRKSLTIRERVLGVEHPDTATSYNNIGAVYDVMGDYPQALEYYWKALATMERVLGGEHPDTATSYNNIGAVYDVMGDFPQALEYYQKALAIREQTLGKEHPDTAVSYNNIGLVYYNRGDFPQALEYLGKALAIREQTLGKEHPDTAASYNNIGVVYDGMGNYPQALEYLGKALAIREQTLRKEHPDTAASYNNIGVVYDGMGDYPQALEYCQKALAIRERIFGGEHQSMVGYYNDIGLLYYKMGDYPQALEYYRKSQAIRERVLGKDHPDTAGSYENIGFVYYKMGDYPQALEYCGKALAIFEKRLGKEHPHTRNTMKAIEAIQELIPQSTNNMSNEHFARFVVGLGEVLWDRLIRKGKTSKKDRSLGGAPANFAYHAAQFGHEGLVVSAIGKDRDGDDIVAKLDTHALPHHLDRVDYPTGTVDADITNPNDPVFTIHTNSAWSHIPFTDELREIAARTKAVCFGTLAQWGRESRQTIRDFLDNCGPDCLRICDINLRQKYFNKSIIRESLRRADILKLNEKELFAVTGLFGYKPAGEEILCRRLMKAYGLKMIILTKGEIGSWVLWKDGHSYKGTPKVKVKSAVGAGDAFTGAFIGSYLNGATIPEAHEVAVRVSAYVCTQKSTMPVIPEDLKRVL